MKSTIETQVMASVGTIYTARKLVSASALKLYVVVGALYGLAQLVWVSRVFENLSRVGMAHTAEFMLAAVMNTDFLVQVTVAALLIAGGSLFVDLVRLPAASGRRFA